MLAGPTLIVHTAGVRPDARIRRRASVVTPESSNKQSEWQTCAAGARQSEGHNSDYS
jgi:hypothetical protein